MTRDELIETMARAASNYACKAIGSDNTWDTASESDRNEIRPAFEVALTALEAAGFVVVPTTLTDRQLLAMETGSSMATVYELALAHSPIRGK